MLTMRDVHPRLIFGKLTTSFTDFATAQYNALNAPSDEAQAILQSASDELKRVSALDASYLVYIGEFATDRSRVEQRMVRS
jgi:hypothetical protein